MSEEIEESQTPEPCPSCGEIIPPEAPTGLCPKCALAGVAEELQTEAEETLPHLRFDAPPIDEIAESFPQLEILELIGCGGMGAVYRARQPKLDREVALKVLPHSLAETPEFTERFSRQGRVLAKLSHPNIVGVHDFGESGGYFFLLMEYVDGVNLRQAMRAGGFTPKQALDVVPEICEALQFAHEEGVLHRDIKPENILLDTKGRVKIADFGIAKLLGDTAKGQTLTQTMAPGTPQYMAPEQIEQSSEIDHRADIYSLGVVFYEMLTGELPIGRFAAPSEKTGVTSDVDEIVFRSLEKERDRRQQSAGELRTEIGSITPLTDVPAPIATPPAFPSKPDPGNRPELALWMTFVGVIFIALLFGMSLMTANADRIELSRQKAPVNLLETRTSQELDALWVEKKELGKIFLEEHPSVQKKSEEIKALNAQLDKLRQLSRRGYEPGTQVILLIAAGYAFIPLFAIPGAVFGWMQLRRQQKIGQRDGRAAVIVAAWFWPMAAVVASIFGLILTPASAIGTDAAFITGISISLVLACGVGVWLIGRTLKWLKRPITATEQKAFLEREPDFALFRRKLIWVIGGIGILVSLCLVFFDVWTGTMIGILWLAFFGVFFWMTKRSCQPRERAELEAGFNPWPKRIFWLVLLIFVSPTAVIILSMSMAAIAKISKSRVVGPYDVSIIRVMPEKVKVNSIIQVRQSMVDPLKVKIVFENISSSKSVMSSEAVEMPSGAVGTLHPGTEMEFISGRGDNRLISLEFAFPDSDLANDAYLQMHQLGGKSRHLGPAFSNLTRLPLFDVGSGEDRYRAWMEFEKLNSSLVE